MEDALARAARNHPCLAWSLVLLTLGSAGCQTYVGTTALSFLEHVRTNPDPNTRYLAYSKLAHTSAYDNQEQKDTAVRTLMDKYERGNEPVASRAIICRTLGELGDPRARSVLIKAVSSPEPIIKIEACRALGKVGQPEDATVLAQVMALDNLEDARIAAIEGISSLGSTDPRITKLLVESMEHEDPAIRLASLNALRRMTRKDLGTDPAAWRRELKSSLEASGQPEVPQQLATPSGAPLSPEALSSAEPPEGLAPAPNESGTPLATPLQERSTAHK